MTQNHLWDARQGYRVSTPAIFLAMVPTGICIWALETMKVLDVIDAIDSSDGESNDPDAKNPVALHVPQNCSMAIHVGYELPLTTSWLVSQHSTIDTC